MSSDSVIVDEVRARAHEISAAYGHDLTAYVRHLQQVQEKYRDRLVSQITVVPGEPRTTSPRTERGAA